MSAEPEKFALLKAAYRGDVQAVKGHLRSYTADVRGVRDCTCLHAAGISYPSRHCVFTVAISRIEPRMHVYNFHVVIMHLCGAVPCVAFVLRSLFPDIKASFNVRSPPRGANTRSCAARASKMLSVSIG